MKGILRATLVITSSILALANALLILNIISLKKSK